MPIDTKKKFSFGKAIVGNTIGFALGRPVGAIVRAERGISGKNGKSGTIGFRGIGFKSVVNYAKTVHLMSGDIKVTFSMDKTRIEIPNIEMVPLICIPHIFSGESFNKETQKIFKNGYTTVFIFETENDSIEQEIQDFNISSMIFLHNLSEILYYGQSEQFWKTQEIKLNDMSKIVTCLNGLTCHMDVSGKRY